MRRLFAALLLFLTPCLKAAAQDTTEFVNEAGTFSLMVAEGRIVAEMAETVGVRLANTQDALQRLMMREPPQTGDARITVSPVPDSVITMFAGIEMDDETLTAETLAALVTSLLQLGPAYLDGGLQLGESETLEFGVSRTAIYIPFSTPARQGAYAAYFDFPERFTTLVMAETFPGEFTETLREVALLVAGSGEYGLPAERQTEPEATPEPGSEWLVEADFGAVTLIVDDAGEGIAAANFTFEDFACGQMTHSGTVSITYEQPIPFEDATFRLTLDLSPPPAPGQAPGSAPVRLLYLTGRLGEDGGTVEGSWFAQVELVFCASGMWTAER